MVAVIAADSYVVGSAVTYALNLPRAVTLVLILGLLALAVLANLRGIRIAGLLQDFTTYALLVSAILISVIAPLTQACFNPARDFGPRVFAALAGWGKVALPGRGTGFLTVYILAPVAGACLGGGLYAKVIGPSLPEHPEDKAA